MTDTKTLTKNTAADKAETTTTETAAKAKLFNLPQIGGGAMAAVTTAVVGSQLGVAGTLIGAAVASVVAAIAGFGQSALLCLDVDIADDPLDPKASRDRRILESADLARAFFSELGVVAAIRVQGRGPLGPIEPDGSVEFSKADDVADFRSVASELQERILHASASAPKSKPRGLRI